MEFLSRTFHRKATLFYYILQSILRSSTNCLAFQIVLLSELLLHNKPKTTIFDMFEISDNILPLFCSTIFLDLITLLQLLLDEFSEIWAFYGGPQEAPINKNIWIFSTQKISFLDWSIFWCITKFTPQLPLLVVEVWKFAQIISIMYQSIKSKDIPKKLLSLFVKNHWFSNCVCAAQKSQMCQKN